MNQKPDEFNADATFRLLNKVAFGYGIHLCIGASLARLEAKVPLRNFQALRFYVVIDLIRTRDGVRVLFSGHEELLVKVSTIGSK